MSEANTKLGKAAVSNYWNSVINIHTHTLKRIQNINANHTPSSPVTFPLCSQILWDKTCMSWGSRNSLFWSSPLADLHTFRHCTLLYLQDHNLHVPRLVTEPITCFLDVLFCFVFKSSLYYFIIYVIVDKITKPMCLPLLNSIIILPSVDYYMDHLWQCLLKWIHILSVTAV